MYALASASVETLGAQPSAAVSSQLVSRLTARELEVARLVGRLSNVEVAQHLGVSVRTVENHVAHALRKTGALDRGMLSALIDSTPRPSR